jgi:hypothetical protein
MTEELAARKEFQRASGAPDVGKGGGPSRGQQVLEGAGIRSVRRMISKVLGPAVRRKAKPGRRKKK